MQRRLLLTFLCFCSSFGLPLNFTGWKVCASTDSVSGSGMYRRVKQATKPELSGHRTLVFSRITVPCTDCFELIEKRSAESRYLVQKVPSKRHFSAAVAGADQLP